MTWVMTSVFSILPIVRNATRYGLIVPRLFEEKRRDTVSGFPWCVVRGAWRVVRGSEFLVGTLSP